MRITDEYVFFFSHKDVFSNWYIAPFTETEPGYNETFCCVEQYMMWRKALLFKDHAIAAAILDHSTIRDNERKQAYYKRMGRAVSGFNNDMWEENRERIVMRGLCLKYVYRIQICMQTYTFTNTKRLLKQVLTIRFTVLEWECMNQGC